MRLVRRVRLMRCGVGRGGTAADGDAVAGPSPRGGRRRRSAQRPEPPGDGERSLHRADRQPLLRGDPGRDPLRLPGLVRCPRERARRVDLEGRRDGLDLGVEVGRLPDQPWHELRRDPEEGVAMLLAGLGDERVEAVFYGHVVRLLVAGCFTR
jgi:hypothetical protein